LLYRLALTGLLFVLAGCMGSLSSAAPPVPQAVGTHPVGVTTIRVFDPSRDRSLAVEVWYPADHVDSAVEPAVYQVQAMGGTVARLRSPANAQREVAPWRDGGPRPVVLLSHGAGSNRYASSTLAEVLASNGYLVAAPDHDGHTTSDEVWGISESDRAQSAYDRPLDLSRVLDALERPNANGNALLDNLADMTRVAVAGHSFGGRTALAMVGARFDVERQARECKKHPDHQLCYTLPVFVPHAEKGHYRYVDKRVKAAFLIAPAGFEFYREDGVAEVDVPVLVVGAKLDRNTPFKEKSQPIFNSLKTSHYLLGLEDAGHLTPTDVCAIIDSTGFIGKMAGGDDAKDGCGKGYMPTAQALELVSDAALAFLDVHLYNDENAMARLETALNTADESRIATATETPTQTF
jgi:predicted dienelactone hydrolase